MKWTFEGYRRGGDYNNFLKDGETPYDGLHVGLLKQCERFANLQRPETALE